MLRPVLRLVLVFCIVYASLFIGAVDRLPLMKALHQVGMTLVLFVWLLGLWRSGRPLPATPLDVPLLALGIAWTLSALFSRDPRVSLEFTWPGWFHILVFYLLVDLTQRDRLWRRCLWVGVFLTGVVVVMLSAVEVTAWYFGLPVLSRISFVQSWPSIDGLSLPPSLHAVSLALNHKNLVGAYCELLIPLAVAWGLTARRRATRWALLSLAAGLIVTLVLAQSRGAYLGLVTIIGLWMLLVLLRDDVRQRLPVRLRPLLDPRLLVAGTVIAAVIMARLVFWETTQTDNPSYDDITRLDLWYSAIQMFKDHPVLGVGPHRFGFERLWYPTWELSPSSLDLRHAHNFVLQVLAEGGLVIFTLTVWLLVRSARVWWAARRDAPPVVRQRLDGIAIALAAFAVHNMVDTFPFRTQISLQLLIIAAYVVANAGRAADDNEAAQSPHDDSWRHRLVPAALALLIIIQVAFIPVHWAGMKYVQADHELDNGQLEKALATIRDAQEIDPWLDLYRLEEAVILGHLAFQDPDTYLAEAIAVSEDSVDRNPAWDLGWHNLAALYAQAGRYADAVEAEQRALERDSWPGEYYLKLGEYEEALGRDSAAQEAWFAALRRKPFLAATGFWRDPAHPARAAVVDAAVEHFADERPEAALDIALYAGDLDRALDIARRAGPDRISSVRLNALWAIAPDEPCIPCYYVALQFPIVREARDQLVRAEALIQAGAPASRAAAEKAARTALFISEGKAVWGWYVLARIGEQTGEDDETIRRWLAHAVYPPSPYQIHFPWTAYTIAAGLNTIPQARVPTQSPFFYRPWVELAARYEAGGEWEDARNIYERIVDQDPYAWDVRARLDRLPEAE